MSDEDLVADPLLAETTGVFTETAGGVTVAAALRLAREGKLRPSDEPVLCITGNGLKTIDHGSPGAAGRAGHLSQVCARSRRSNA